jgi:DNA-3-methyladenine glycosylase I
MLGDKDSGVVMGEDGIARCFWADSATEYRAYHDTEWGFPVSNDIRLFEKLCLEGFQAGLSWLTILRKRENFRQAFAGFDYTQVAGFDADDVTRLLDNAGIIRHRGKIEATINNAGRALELVEQEGSLATYLWRFEPESRPGSLNRAGLAQRTTSDEAKALAKDLKRRGWRFVGPTTVYAFMQAMGLVNDHLDGCAAQSEARAARVDFTPP